MLRGSDCVNATVICLEIYIFNFCSNACMSLRDCYVLYVLYYFSAMLYASSSLSRRKRIFRIDYVNYFAVSLNSFWKRSSVSLDAAITKSLLMTLITFRPSGASWLSYSHSFVSLGQLYFSYYNRACSASALALVYASSRSSSSSIGNKFYRWSSRAWAISSECTACPLRKVKVGINANTRTR